MSEQRRYFVVIREPGGAWDSSRSMQEQDGWEPHAEFIDGLAERVEERLDEDPWSDPRVRIARIEPLKVLLEAS